MINGFPTHIYQTFVGSLRATGYSGNIILGIASDAPTSTVDYLASQNVTIKYIENAEKCTYNGTKSNTEKVLICRRPTVGNVRKNIQTTS